MEDLFLALVHTQLLNCSKFNFENPAIYAGFFIGKAFESVR